MELANSFSDLTLGERNILSDYIEESFIGIGSINYDYSAYGLKQRFTRLHNLSKHVSSRCFMEAMVAAGYTAKPIPNAKPENWNFNIGVPLYNRKR